MANGPGVKPLPVLVKIHGRPPSRVQCFRRQQALRAEGWRSGQCHGVVQGRLGGLGFGYGTSAVVAAEQDDL
jgi:hypothetical protein